MHQIINITRGDGTREHYIGPAERMADALEYLSASESHVQPPRLKTAVTADDIDALGYPRVGTVYAVEADGTFQPLRPRDVDDYAQWIDA